MTSDIRKAAVLLSNLSQETRGLLLSLLEPRLAAALAVQIAELGTVSVNEVQATTEAFVAATRPMHSESTVNESRIGSGMDLLNTVPDRQLLTLLIEEQPPVIAAVLQEVSEARAARLLASLPQPLRLAVVRRLATLGPIASDVVRDIQWAILERLSAASVPYSLMGYSVFRLATILDSADFRTRHELLSRLAVDDPHLAAAICHRLRILCDIENRDPGTMSRQDETHQARAAA
ncbi:MAG: hypothetical protein K8T91_12725 [Planctomycetes bacterium]|nr:hypothetical protein [Planctomycetota bacterium]